MIFNKVCKNCCKEFKTSNAKKAYCTTKCQQASYRRRRYQHIKDYMKEYKASKISKEDKNKPSQSLAEAQLNARKMGLSYGEYVLQIERRLHERY